MVLLLLVFMQLTRDLFAIAKFLSNAFQTRKRSADKFSDMLQLQH